MELSKEQVQELRLMEKETFKLCKSVSIMCVIASKLEDIDVDKIENEDERNIFKAFMMLKDEAYEYALAEARFHVALDLPSEDDE